MVTNNIIAIIIIIIEIAIIIANGTLIKSTADAFIRIGCLDQVTNNAIIIFLSSRSQVRKLQQHTILTIGIMKMVRSVVNAI
jgi:hypothetical protein